MLFRGAVTGQDWANTGYIEGTHELTGTGKFAGHAPKVWFRNAGYAGPPQVDAHGAMRSLRVRPADQPVQDRRQTRDVAALGNRQQRG